MQRVVLESCGHYHPENIIDNTFFDRLDIGSDAAWVVDRVGIESRCSVLSEEQLMQLRRGDLNLNQLRAEGKVMSIAEMSRRAWENLKSKAKQAPQPQMVLCGTSVPDFDIPANASTIAAAIGVEALAFDCNSACSSFVLNLHVARSMILAGTARSAAIFNPERYSMRLNYEDRASCVLFGDGCASAYVSADGSNGFEVIDTHLESLPSKHDLIQIPIGGHFQQNGAAVQKFAISRTMETTLRLLERNDLRPKDVQYFIGHQANLRMVTSAAHKLGFDAHQHLYNVDRFGNQGAAGAPAVMSMNWSRFQSGDYLAIAVVGSGLTWGAALLRRL